MATAIVTGGRGIGAAVAARLARHPAVAGLAVLSRSVASAERGAAAAREAAAAGDVKANVLGLQCDVADPAQVARAVARVRDALGPARLLVNAAGVTSDGLLVRATDEALRGTIDANLLGPMFLSRALIKDMVRGKQGGSIVNIGSVLGSRGGAGQAAYCASKAGLQGLTKSLAIELGPRQIRVNLVEPGYIETDMTAGLDKASIAAKVPLGRLGTAEEVAATVEFLLLHEHAKYITGSVLRVDGGIGC